ncbi:uncharacterized [Tachysurus ichikawai]
MLAWFPVLQRMHMLRITVVAAKARADFCFLAAPRPSHALNPSALLQHINHSSLPLSRYEPKRTKRDTVVCLAAFPET